MNNFERTKTQTQANTPAIRGPFRALIISFLENNDFTEFKEIYPSLTFEHPNFHFCKSDKHKCIIYYKYPYDVATLISKYQNKVDLRFSIYYDELTKTLQPDVLYVVTKNTDYLLAKVEQLDGEIMYKTRIGFHIKFADFKTAAIAHEELRREFSAKFAYKSKVLKYSNPQKITKQDEEKYQLKNDIKLLIKKYKGIAMNQECENELNAIRGRQRGFNQERIRKAAEDLSFANISWNNQIEDAQEEEENKDEESNAESIFDELERLYKHL